VEARKWRIQSEEQVKRYEKERRKHQIQEAIQWLGLQDDFQRDHLETLLRRKHPGTCDWVMKKNLLKAWFESGPGCQVLWLKGIPGAGEWNPHTRHELC
jgi:hypothetical protein